MQKLLAKIENLEVWQDGENIKIIGLVHMKHVYISRSEFFLIEKLMHKVVQGFLNGD